MKKNLFCLFLVMLIMLSFSLSVYAQPAPLGACCWNNNIYCESPVTAESCSVETDDGIWHANVTCEDNPCRTGIPTMNEWGMIIFAMLSGFGIIYFLRKQKKAEN